MEDNEDVIVELVRSCDNSLSLKFTFRVLHRTDAWYGESSEFVEADSAFLYAVSLDDLSYISKTFCRLSGLRRVGAISTVDYTRAIASFGNLLGFIHDGMTPVQRDPDFLVQRVESDALALWAINAIKHLL